MTTAQPIGHSETADVSTRGGERTTTAQPIGHSETADVSTRGGERTTTSQPIGHSEKGSNIDPCGTPYFTMLRMELVP